MAWLRNQAIATRTKINTRVLFPLFIEMLIGDVILTSE